MRRVEAARPLRLGERRLRAGRRRSTASAAPGSTPTAGPQAGARAPRLRRPDRPRRGAARAPRHRRLGALAARRRARPHPGRRGAGHEPGAVAGDRGDLGGVLRRRRRPRRPPHDLRRRRREAVDLQLPGRRPARVRRPLRPLRPGADRDRLGAAALRPALLVPLGARRSSSSSTRCSAARPAQGLAGRSPTMRSTPRSPAASSSGRSCRSRRSRTRDRGTRRSTPARPTTRSRCWPGASPREIAGWLASGRALPGDPDGRGDPRRRRDDPGAAARRPLPRDHPGAQARAGAGRRRRPAPDRRRARRQRPPRRAPGRRDPGRRPLARGAAQEPARRRQRARALRARASAPAELCAGRCASSRRSAGPRCGRCSTTCWRRPTTCGPSRC